MKITDRMLGDHKTFRKIISEIDLIAARAAPQRDLRRLMRLVEIFKDHLTLHAWGEDVFYYPAVRTQAVKTPLPPITAAYMDAMLQDHRAIDSALGRLEKEVKAKPPAASWPQTHASFCRELTDHMKKEEDDLFPLSEKLLGEDRLEDLSRELQRRRSEAPKARFHLRLEPS